ncbi:MAG: vancomycin aglycone glucosyltransferase [Pseudonocardiales bacterium]|nr:vancomycin aglycone glucosyltransferase [Pseudonocardiales bacterium]
MRVLLSTIGSRGDVQPVVALAAALRDLGQEPRVCAPPDFGAWIEGLGIGFVPIGPEVRQTAKPSPSAARALPSPEQRRQLIEGTVAAQFEVIPAAADGCDVIVGATALQIAARSVAELRGIPYVYASYCPTALPSPHHAPPVLTMLGEKPADGTVDNRALWAADAQRLNDTWGEALNSHRAALGLPPVDDVRSHVFTDTPWLAADPTLAPWPETRGLDVFQTGAWILPDQHPLSAELENWLDAGEPPVYFGFGSIRAPEDLSKTMIESARALGRRAIISRGWADLSLTDDEPDCISIGDVNQQALFPRVAAVVHHGGAGTTTAATRAGAPQVVIPQHYDQHYFARRVRELGIGTAHPPAVPITDSLTATLSRTLQPEVAARAKPVADAVRTDGAQVAARRLMTAASPGSP